MTVTLARSAGAPDVGALLRRHWGFDALRPLQARAIDAAIAGRDTLAVMPTGGGKSLCYQVPPLVLGGLTVVVSPLIALMKDQVDGLRLAGYPAVAMHSGMTAEEARDAHRAVRSGEVRLLYVAPERLFGSSVLDGLPSGGVGGVKAFAIDEAHCISQWGHDFRPEYRRLAELRRRFPAAAFHAFTATATPRVREDIVAQLGLRNPDVIVGRFDRPNLTYRIVPRVNPLDQIEKAVRRHGSHDAGGQATIVYCISRKRTEAVAEELRRRGVHAEHYHAGLAAAERRRVQDDFAQERLSVVVATVAFGMGIDRSDVRCVIHAEMPRSVEHYQQETGRAGRDGLPAECVLLYAAADAEKWASLINMSAEETGATPEYVDWQLAQVDHVRRLCCSGRCRHRALSEFFGQEYRAGASAETQEGEGLGLSQPPPLAAPTPPLGGQGAGEGATSGTTAAPRGCSACDVCLGELETVPDSKVVAQKILSCVARMSLTPNAAGYFSGFGAAHVMAVLRGSMVKQVVERGHDKLSTFGLLRNVGKDELGSYINQLIDLGVLERTAGQFPTLVCNRASREVLRGEREIMLVRAREVEADVAGTGAAAPATGVFDPGMFDRLREVRREIAAERGVPAYIVFGDATLQEMAAVRPTRTETFLWVKGVGEQKEREFGDRFRAAIAEYCADKGLSTDQGAARKRRPSAFTEPRPSGGGCKRPIQ